MRLFTIPYEVINHAEKQEKIRLFFVQFLEFAMEHCCCCFICIIKTLEQF
jgi:hypothetical protein